MYRIGIEEHDSTFYAIVLTNNDKVLWKGKNKDLTELLNLLDESEALKGHDIEYAAFSTDIVNSISPVMKRTSPIVLIKVGGSKDNFSYVSTERNSRPFKGLEIHNYFIKGAMKPYGEEESPLDSKEIKKIAKILNEDKSVKGVGIIGQFSNFLPQHEEKIARELNKTIERKISICLSSLVSHRSLVYRERLLVMNLILAISASQHLIFIAEKLKEYLGRSRLYFLGSDGSLVPNETALNYPVLLNGSSYVSKIVGLGATTDLKDLNLITKLGKKIVLMSSFDGEPVLKRKEDTFKKGINVFSSGVMRPLSGRSEEIELVIRNLKKKDETTTVIDKSIFQEYPKLNTCGARLQKVDGYLGAMGAVSAPIRLTMDFLGSIQFSGRKEILESFKNIVREKIIEVGAKTESVRVVQVEEIPLSYLPWDSLRIRISVEGRPGGSPTSGGKRK